MIEDHETLQLEAARQNFPFHTRSLGRRNPHRNRHGTALDNSAEPIHAPNDRVGNFTCDVIEEDINPAGASLCERLRNRTLIVHKGVEAEILAALHALFIGTHDGHRPAAGVLGQLSDDTADCTGTLRDYDRLPFFWLAYVLQGQIGRQTVNPKYTGGRGQRRLPWIDSPQYGRGLANAIVL